MNANYANDTGLAGLNRRRLLVAGPALVAASALPAVSAAEEPSPVAALFQQWKGYSAWLEGPATKDMPEEEFDAAVDVRNALEDQMIATPARDAADLLMMITAYSDYGVVSIGSRDELPELWEQVRAFFREGGAA